MFYVAGVAIPFICALLRYAVAYGYQGVSRDAAWQSAKGALTWGVCVIALLFAFHH